MKRLFKLLLLIVLIAVAGLYWLGTREPDLNLALPQVDLKDAKLIEQGQKVALLGNCMGCHTATGQAEFAGGRAIYTDFGTFYGPNLTPDTQYGIGTWTQQDFWRALHHGKGKDGTLLYPSFPFPDYTAITPEDATALFAYLQSLPAVNTPNQAHELTFPYSQRWLLIPWRALFFKPQSTPNDSTQTAQWNRGLYLTQTLGHCGTCHTPRNRLGASIHDQALQGATILGWYAPPLVGNANDSLSRWTAQDIADLLQSGHSVHGNAIGPMAEVVYQSTQHWSDEDVLAVGVYLASQRNQSQAIATPTDNTQLSETLGGKLYTQNCAQCHGDNGEGDGTRFPALKGNSIVNTESPANLIRIIFNGGFSAETQHNPRPYSMPPFRASLTDEEVLAIVNYSRQRWGQQLPTVNLYQVANERGLVPN